MMPAYLIPLKQISPVPQELDQARDTTLVPLLLYCDLLKTGR